MQLNEQRFLMLTALAAEPRHGYGLVEAIAEVTEGRHRPRPGALYHGLDRLCDQGLVRVDREELVEGRLRRYYALTEPGRLVLAEEARHRQQTAVQALRQLGLLT